MGRFRSSFPSGVAILLGLPSARPLARGRQAQAGPPASHKSVYGKLQSVDKGQNAVLMKSNTGERLTWRFEPA